MHLVPHAFGLLGGMVHPGPGGRPGDAVPGASSVPVGAVRIDDATWDAWVADLAGGSFLQLTAWSDAMSPHGWRASRLWAWARGGPVVGQLLTWPLRPGPWRRGYAPRAPLAPELDEASVIAFTEMVRVAARQQHLTHVVVDPEVDLHGPVAGWLAAAGWRQVPAIQCDVTRVVDLQPTEAELWSRLHPKWRQNVHRAQHAGITVEEAGPEGLADLEAIYGSTAARIGFRRRSMRSIHDAFTARGAARILLARTVDGTAVAGFLLLDCGDRVTSLFGGFTQAGLDVRAAYLLEWETIRRSRDRGMHRYDLWGTDSPRLATFKGGFGGDERHYIGAWELVTAPVPYRLHAGLRRARARVRGGGPEAEA